MALRLAGWRAIVIWECQINRQQLTRLAMRLLTSTGPSR
jgi:G:T-mismatch repair DNA endonuclease (very short patch repair protein)